VSELVGNASLALARLLSTPLYFLQMCKKNRPVCILALLLLWCS